MARVQVLLCFTILYASATLLNVVSAHLKYEPALPTIDAPKTVKDVEPYTVKVVMTFVVNLEKECPKSQKFQLFFEKLRAYAKYVCPIAIVKKGTDLKGYDSDRKAKIGSLLQAMSSFARGSIKKVLQEEKKDVLNTFNWMQSVAGKIMGGREEDESEETKELTTEQQKEIKEGILKWEQVITKCVNTMVQSSDEKTEKSKESSSKSSSSSSSSFSSFQDTTGGDLGSPSESPASSPSGSSGGSFTSLVSSSESPASSSSGSSGGSFTRLASSSGSPTSSSSGSISVKGGSGSSFEDSTGGSLDTPAESPTGGASGPSSGSGEISMSGSGSQFQDTTGGSLGGSAESPQSSPAASPKNCRSGSSSSKSGSSITESSSAFKDTTGETSLTSPSASPAGSPSGSITENGSSSSRSSSSKSSSSGSASSSSTETSSSSSTVEEVENETSTQVMTFISNLEKKCPKNEEFKGFFEKLKGTMEVAFPGASKPSSPKALISGMRAAAGKLSDAMAFVRSRIKGKSAEAKTSMEKYQEEVIKSLQELQDINSKIVRENHGKKQGSAVTVSTTQRTEIKQTITRWEQVTTQFVETAAQSETTQSSSSSSQKSSKSTAN